MASQFTFYEFFAGGGMARLGLGSKWRPTFANDLCEKKAASYRTNFPPAEELVVRDIAKVALSDLPGTADLAWASFPCIDLSLAGNGAGLSGVRSGTFWPFWNLMRDLGRENRAPRLVVLENVIGAITSHNGKDLDAILQALIAERYRVGALVADAALFLPQSRPRLFVIGIDRSWPMPPDLCLNGPTQPWHPRAIREAFIRLSPTIRRDWVWWRVAGPPTRKISIEDVIEDNPQDVEWWSREETQRLLSQMSEVNRKKVKVAQDSGDRRVGFVYRRMRLDENGKKVQRAEVRFDGMSGCLRTPVGGSSRQFVLVVDGRSIRARLLSAREAARLMGLRDSYKLPENYNEAYHLAGDGLAVPVVAWLAKALLTPLASNGWRQALRAFHE